MLFFVKGEMKQASAVSQEQFLELQVAHWDVVVNQNKQRKILLGGQFAGTNAGFVVYNADSEQELRMLLSQDPMTSLMELDILPLTPRDAEILPLSSPELALQSAKQALEDLREKNN